MVEADEVEGLEASEGNSEPSELDALTAALQAELASTSEASE
ncbi:MAG: hypothetical protein ACJARN_001231 [Arenicella sp.]|jgi:hypothetical protein